jgi:F420-non-reducing hydrogenase iron-sulfur subunit
MAEYEPQIVAFACNWCSYAGADTAGVNRIQYSPHIRVIRTMCSGRVKPSYIIKAFQMGADGVLVSGCHFGDCHYVFGNHRAVELFEKTKNIIKLLGIEENRLRLEWVSAAEGGRWAQLIDEFVAEITRLGPSPLRRADQKSVGKQDQPDALQIAAADAAPAVSSPAVEKPVKKATKSEASQTKTKPAAKKPAKKAAPKSIKTAVKKTAPRPPAKTSAKAPAKTAGKVKTSTAAKVPAKKAGTKSAG